MKRTRTSLIAAAAVVGSLFASPPAAAADRGESATVNVIHGIPGVAVKVCVNGTRVIDDFRYTERLVGAQLPDGTYRVKVVGAGEPCGSKPILTESFTLADGKNYTVVANLNAHGTPNLSAFVNPVGPTPQGRARLTVRHAANAPAVNVRANGQVLIGGNEFTWGETVTTGVPAQSYRVKVTLPGDTAPVIGPKDLSLRDGTAYQAFAVGTEGSYRIVVIGTHVGQR